MKNRMKTSLDIGKNYLVDTTGLLLTSHPIYAGMEVFGAGMSIATSLETRLKVSLLAYSGLGFAFVKGRDLSRKLFGLTDTSKEWKQTLHDSIYNVTINFALSIPIYLSSGATWDEILKASSGASLLGIIAGPINGYSIDTFRHLTGTKYSERMPKLIQKASRKTKKVLAIASILAMLGATKGIYEVKDKYFSESQKQEIILENKVQSNYSSPTQ